MKGSDLEFEEAVRLVRKFFPESKRFMTQKTGIDWDLLLGAMQAGDYHADHACDPMRESDAPDLGLALKGGLGGTNDEVYRRLLEHTRIVPTGRAVVVPDAIGRSEWSSENCPPFVCDSSRVSERLSEDFCFGCCRNSLFVYENGMALLVDHDERVHWSRSRRKR